MKYKYINVENLGFIIWPDSDHVWHKHIAQACQMEEPHKIISAGFADIIGGTVRCYGKSESLGISSRPEDSHALAYMLGQRENPHVIPQRLRDNLGL